MAARLLIWRIDHFPRLRGWTSGGWRMYRGDTVTSAQGVHSVDLRSDVVTQPSQEMKEVMMSATTGDDVFGEDPTINKLQSTMAALFGMEAALFVPSGTMGNLIAVLSHCHTRGLEALFGDKCHMIVYEQGGMATLGGVHPRTIPNLTDGTFDLDLVEERIRPLDDCHQPFTGLVCVEDTHNVCGGTVLPLDFLANLRKIADDHGLPIHMDGARMMNAAAYLEVDPKVILQHVDSVNLCFSKGLGAPIGSIIAGSAEFIARSVRLRKVLGGGMRQPGMLAAAALFTLDNVIPRLQTDHRHAQILAKAIMKGSYGMVHIDVDMLHSNIIMVHMLKDGLTAQQFCDRLSQVTEEERDVIGESIAVQSFPFSKRCARLVTHSSVTTQDIQMATTKILYVLEELANQDTGSKVEYVHQ